MKHNITFAIVMGLCTTGIISFTVVAVNIGFNEHFIKTWLRSWGIGYIVVVPTILFVGPLVKRFVDGLYMRLEKNDPSPGPKRVTCHSARKRIRPDGCWSETNNGGKEELRK